MGCNGQFALHQILGEFVADGSCMDGRPRCKRNLTISERSGAVMYRPLNAAVWPLALM